MLSYRVVTLGCKVNQYESLQVEEFLRQRGYTRCENDTPDVLILNTCSVTSGAAAKSRNLLRRMAKSGMKVITLGCWATSHTDTARRIAGDNAVLTHQDDLANQLGALLEGEVGSLREKRAAKSPGTVSLPLLSHRQSGTQRAILKIQDGCDAHCTYCIIPKLRPVLWSKPTDSVVEECRQLVAAGHQEIVLTGIFLGAYGQATALHRRQDSPASGQLAKLIETICTQVPSLPRIRLSSLEPADVTDDLITTLRRHRQVMPHFHIPLQSGSDAMLHRMNRQYTREDYLRMTQQLKAAFDRPALTTDIIVGFPGETDACFAETLAVAREVGFLHIHAFPFSPREGTAAARWKKQFVHPQTVTDRMHQLEQLTIEQGFAYRQKFLEQTVEVLIEKPGSSDGEMADPGAPVDDNEHDATNIRHGRCERYFAVHFELPAGSPDPTGQRVKVRITRATPHRTIGEVTDG